MSHGYTDRVLNVIFENVKPFAIYFTICHKLCNTIRINIGFDSRCWMKRHCLADYKSFLSILLSLFWENTPNGFSLMYVKNVSTHRPEWDWLWTFPLKMSYLFAKKIFNIICIELFRKNQSNVSYFLRTKSLHRWSFLLSYILLLRYILPGWHLQSGSVWLLTCLHFDQSFQPHFVLLKC